MVYLNKVCNWPMSLTPMNGESGDTCKKTSQRKEKGEAFVSISVYGERSKSLLHVFTIMSLSFQSMVLLSSCLIILILFHNEP